MYTITYDVLETSINNIVKLSIKKEVMKSTKKQIQTLALLAMSLVFSITVANAQPNGERGPRPIPDETQIEKKVERMEKELALTKDQKEKISELFTAHFDQMKAEREKVKPQMEQMRAKNEELRKELETSIIAQLTPEQAKKFEEFNKKRGEKKPNGRQHPEQGRKNHQ